MIPDENRFPNRTVDFIDQNPAGYITDQVNKAYADESSELNQHLVTLQMNTIEKEER